MTKSDRHKKLRRKEKNKTQLTGVKKLGRSQNVIEPTFKAKKILLREQLQGPSEGDSVQISRNRSLADVLHSLSHHNTNIKKDAILGLLEIITSQPDALTSNLDKILEKIGALALNEEDSIRKENIRMAEAIFGRLTEEQMKPFWNLVISYVKCSLTHLNSDVRRSSIHIVTLLLSFFPNLMYSSFHILLPIVLGLISSGAGKPRTSKWSNTGSQGQPQLKLDITSKQSGSALRIKVLKFLESCIELHTAQERARKEAEANHNGSCISLSWEDSKTFVGLSYTYGYQETRIQSPQTALNGSSTLDYFTSAGTTHDFSSGVREDKEFWPKFVELCLPILYQTWLELTQSEEDVKSYAKWTDDRNTGTDGTDRTLTLTNAISNILNSIERPERQKKASR